MKCKICDKDVGEFDFFTLNFKQVYICNTCANSIVIQQINFLIEERGKENPCKRLQKENEELKALIGRLESKIELGIQYLKYSNGEQGGE